jgi:hypothetical protein
MAEREGFEPPEPLGSPDFESGRLNQTPEPLRAGIQHFRYRANSQARAAESGQRRAMLA